MEDAYTAVPFLLEVPVSGGAQEDLIPPRIAPQVRSASGCLPDSTTAASPRQAAWLPCQLPYGGHHSAACLAKAHAVGPQAAHREMSALHFFGVFDGHGGAEAALLCARTLHERLAEALHSGGAMQPQQQHQLSDELPQASGNSASSSCTAVSVRSASDVDPTAASAAASAASAPSATYNQAGAGDAMSAGTSEDMDCEDAAARQQLHQQSSLLHPTQQQPGHHPQQQQPQQPHQAAADLPYSANAFEHAFTEAFSKVDEEFGKKQDQDQVGTPHTCSGICTLRRIRYCWFQVHKPCLSCSVMGNHVAQLLTCNSFELRRWAPPPSWPSSATASCTLATAVRSLSSPLQLHFICCFEAVMDLVPI